ncbi:hypothetical protein U1Q18_006928 [Sarracenia purpurea var. burkii]
MVMLCFVLDLRSLSPPLLRDLKQLANFYAVLAPTGEKPRSKPLSDRIALCYVVKNRNSYLDELKVAYTPRMNFSLRDFHHAVNNLPTDAFLPELNDSGALSGCDMNLRIILSSEVLYSCDGHKNDIARKVILISSCMFGNPDSFMKEALMVREISASLSILLQIPLASCQVNFEFPFGVFPLIGCSRQLCFR